MPAQKPKKSVQAAAKTKPAAKAAPKPAAKPAAKAAPAKKPVTKAAAKPAGKAAAAPAKSVKKAAPVPAKKTVAKASETDKTRKAKTKAEQSEAEVKKTAKAKAAEAEAAPAKKTAAKKAIDKPAKAPVKGAKRGPKKKGSIAEPAADEDLHDIEDDLEGEPVAETTEKAKPLRMKISKAKERALMKEFGLDETILTEEEMNKRRQRLKTLIKLGKTRGYLTHAEINDHLPDKLVDAETLEVVIATLNDLGVAVYEQTPDAETLIITDNAPTGSTEEEAEEAAEAALSTVDSEFGRTTDPVRMYMREMGTVELLTREGEIEIAKRIEGGLMDMMEAISASPATIAEILRMAADIREGKVVISTVVDGFSNLNEADDYVAEEDFDEFDEADDDDGKGGS
jgi:RNA polymerase primary sigma factor